MKSFVIDLGGTKARMAFVEDTVVNLVTVVDVDTSKYSSLRQAMEAYLGGLEVLEKTAQFDSIGVGVAGPVSNGRAHVTNLNWHICEGELLEAFSGYGAKSCKFLNDLEAFAWGILNLDPSSLICLAEPKSSRQTMPGENVKSPECFRGNQGNQGYKGNKVVVAAGTGLGMAAMVQTLEGEYIPFATEGGHTSFSPCKEDQHYLSKLADIYGEHTSFERVVSGKFGFNSLYQILSEEFDASHSEPFTQVLPSDLGPEVVKYAVQGNPLALKILDKFLFYYGVVASNFALMQKSTGGLYLAGGIAPKLKSFLTDGSAFMEGFLNKGRFSEFLAEVPIYLVENELCALSGCASFLEKASKTHQS